MAQYIHNNNNDDDDDQIDRRCDIVIREIHRQPPLCCFNNGMIMSVNVSPVQPVTRLGNGIDAETIE